MKCANCGMEFGSGANCQNCGIDRVTGLGNYSGYDNHARSNYSRFSNGVEFCSNKTTVCYACNEIIPSDAEYCPYCRKKLYETCPKCGKTHSSQFDNCPTCGTNRHDYYIKLEAKKQEEKRREREERYKNEAQDLRENLPPSVTNVSIILITAWLLFCFTPICPFTGNGISSLLVIIGASVLIWIITAMICLSIRDKNIRNWKEEHPNDPRSKYL